MHTEQILPGSWVGVLGGGQLGRMFAQVAHRMGYRVAVWEPEVDSPAAQVADRHFSIQLAPEHSDRELITQLSQLCDVVTLEFENIPADHVDTAAQHAFARPGVDFLRICQHRRREKEAVQQAGCPTTPFCPVNSLEELCRAGDQLGWPMVLKTAESGYDGKGQCLVRNVQQATTSWHSLNAQALVAEQWIDYLAEVSMIAARNAAGQFVCYPLFENQHSHHILDITRCPARDELSQLQSEAEEICRAIADRYQVEGLFCIEFFVTRNEQLLVNEMAPRPHNSGHLTIEAFDICQFEMQLRAICNLPLRTPVQLAPAAMANLLGDLWSGGQPNWSSVLQREQTYLHLYGKSQPRPGRKMGHITTISSSEDPGLLADRARQALTCRETLGASHTDR